MEFFKHIELENEKKKKKERKIAEQTKKKSRSTVLNRKLSKW
jgi:hypothetical protein